MHCGSLCTHPIYTTLLCCAASPPPDVLGPSAAASWLAAAALAFRGAIERKTRGGYRRG